MRKTFLILILVLAALLRLINLDKYPSGLNADEAAIGYNAWSLINTGRDEHNHPWPMVFQSFDDYKPAVYFYLVLPFVKILGLNIWAVRLPSALLGVASVYLLYLLVKILAKKTKDSSSEGLALASAFVLATSPWHLQFSRGGWEVNVSTFFVELAVYALISSFQKISKIFLFVFATILALYTYHSVRIVLPLLLLVVVITYWEDFKNLFSKANLKTTLLAALLGFALIAPLTAQMLSKEGQSRFTGVSVFSDEGPVWEALELRRQHLKETRLVRYLHSRYVTYSLRFTKNYLSHLSPRFLFLEGDEIARSKVPEVGQSLLVFAPFFFIGFLSLLRFDTKLKKIFFAWLIISPIAASLTFQSPHALRAQNMSIPLSLISGLGIVSFFGTIKSTRLAILSWFAGLVFLILFSLDFGRYLHQYYIHYPKVLPYAWQFGFDQIAEFSKENYNSYDKIIISDRYDQPYILMAFFLKYPPQTLQAELVMTPRDKFGFSTVRSMGKFEFRAINWEKDKALKNTLIISADESVDDSKVIKIISDPLGKPMYKALSTNI